MDYIQQFKICTDDVPLKYTRSTHSLHDNLRLQFNLDVLNKLFKNINATIPLKLIFEHTSICYKQKSMYTIYLRT